MAGGFPRLGGCVWDESRTMLLRGVGRWRSSDTDTFGTETGSMHCRGGVEPERAIKILLSRTAESG